jgi:pimeloyl-ACP methyl ester carboxylesterase
MITAMAFIERDGVKLYYEDAGKDSDLAPLVLVHGWTCFHGHLAPQAAHFGPERRVVSVDLRGHGQSDVAGPFTIEQFADDVAWLSEQLGLERLVAIGHSMGGNVVVQLAATRPDLARAAVAIDSPFAEAGAFTATAGPMLEALKGPGYQAALDAMIAGSMFGPHDDPAGCAEITAVMSSAKQEVAAGALEAVLSWPGADVLRSCTVPVLTISAGPGGVAGMTALVADCPQLYTAQTVGAGHFNQVFAADQVNAMLEKFLALVG